MHFQQSSNNYNYLYLLLFQSHCRWDSLFQTCLSFPVFQSRYRMRLCILESDSHRIHPVPTSTPLKNRYSHPIPSFCYVVEKKRRHILPICHFLCFFFISINLNNSMHFRQSSNNKYLYLLLFQSHCRWDSLFQTCLSFPVFQSRYRMRLSILEVDSERTGVDIELRHMLSCAQTGPRLFKI